MSDLSIKPAQIDNNGIQLPFQQLSVNLQYAFLDKLSYKELCTLVGDRSKMNSFPDPKWKQEVFRYCASRHIRVEERKSRLEGKILSVAQLKMLDKENLAVAVANHEPKSIYSNELFVPWSTFSTVLHNHKFQLYDLNVIDITQSIVDFLISTLTPYCSQIRYVALKKTWLEQANPLKEYKEDGGALGKLLKHFDAKTLWYCGPDPYMLRHTCVQKIETVYLLQQIVSSNDIKCFTGKMMSIRKSKITTKDLQEVLEEPLITVKNLFLCDLDENLLETLAFQSKIVIQNDQERLIADCSFGPRHTPWRLTWGKKLQHIGGPFCFGFYRLPTE